MKVRDVMRPFPATIDIRDTIGLAAQMLLWSDAHYLPVTENGELVGMVSDHDIALYQARAGERTANENPIGTIVTLDPATAAADDPVGRVAEQMAALDIGAMAVVAARGRVVGLVTSRDMLGAQVRAGLERSEREDDAEPRGLAVRDVMTPDPLCVAEDDALMDAAARMQRYRVRHLPVVDGEHRAVGMLSDRDVRSALGDPLWILDVSEVDAELEQLRVEDVMSAPAIVVSPHDSCATIAHAFADLAVSAVPVVDPQGRVIGVLSYVDLLRGLAGARPPGAALRATHP